MKHAYLLVLLGLSFVLALSHPTSNSLNLKAPLSERLQKFHDKMNNHLDSMERPDQGRQWLSPNAEMYQNHFSRLNSEVLALRQIQHQKDSLEEKIQRVEKKLNDLKRTQRYQAALERVIERLSKKKSQ